MKARLLLTLTAALVLAASPTGIRADEEEEALGKELGRLQGLWRVESQERDGKATQADELKKRTLFFGNDKFLVRQGDAIAQLGTMKLYPTESPTAVDVSVLAGPDKGQVLVGIYELKGDTLRMCLDPKGRTRPTEFKAPEKSGLLLTVYKREKPQTDEPDIAGTYLCEGTQLEGLKYKARVEITKLGDSYSVKWTRGLDMAHLGVGIRKGNLLSVCFLTGKGAGIAVYRIEKGPKLIGEWTELGGIGLIQAETLTREK